ncbi:conserved Plasmodium protein, unknown function [Plasmodium knowlesi strain H]|uniref:Microprotein domain-containing protein n=3 Tax=Plasmodium knowlesi TaxID=5850 RepID=A0A5K1UYE9_PLAKH|nr:ATP synthase-associated protein, putative [Plasmodium knowlesi strain H]OTN67384.1 Uncharacterized protein PKNOH_S06435100 [Plasmodium knowlesi]CAA9987621.1 ATP synthase-associated protein, putative [Plasmodium knowlesi strain H]SBO26979.1 conserved Plasmodium protein, unknown function [Plasmodium knowlesi strain H]SBO29258.1 conserved Plasmodium protein, unknown function [Plasmodium knowlesi strain H]VVS77095.1 ATP synthase-associated protein, putative [Plasmodium knowlesi strain H]|eukprot:XP_002258621.1 hypothetical protein, conserved in Plasmodium species [Plasmodium knowlesi strain H]
MPNELPRLRALFTNWVRNSAMSMRRPSVQGNKCVQMREITQNARGKGTSATAAAGGTMLLISPIMFEAKHKEEENNPKTEYIFMAGKTIDFLTQKIFENEFGTSILYLTFFVAYLALLAHDNKVNLLVQKLKFKYANNMFSIGHPNYAKYLNKLRTPRKGT